MHVCIVYRADGTAFQALADNEGEGEFCGYGKTVQCATVDHHHRWRSPIHMPRWASRLTLEITDIRVERLQTISEIDASDEGAGIYLANNPQWDGDPNCYRKLYRLGWDVLNTKRGHPWQSNPWVWVITFRQTGVRG